MTGSRTVSPLHREVGRLLAHLRNHGGDFMSSSLGECREYVDMDRVEGLEDHLDWDDLADVADLESRVDYLERRVEELTKILQERDKQVNILERQAYKVPRLKELVLAQNREINLLIKKELA